MVHCHEIVLKHLVTYSLILCRLESRYTSSYREQVDVKLIYLLDFYSSLQHRVDVKSMTSCLQSHYSHYHCRGGECWYTTADSQCQSTAPLLPGVGLHGDTTAEDHWPLHRRHHQSCNKQTWPLASSASKRSIRRFVIS